MILYAAADRVVPADQVAPLREGIETFLLASQLTLVDMDQANATFPKAREMAKTLPEPSATLLTYVNDRNVKALGPAARAAPRPRGRSGGVARARPRRPRRRSFCCTATTTP